MRIGGRISAAIEVLAEILERHRPASIALRDWGNTHRFAGSGDRSAIGNIVYDALRRRASISWHMDDTSPGALAAGVMIGGWGYGHDELAAELADDRHAPQLDWAAAYTAWQQRSSEPAPDHVRAEVPAWCAAELTAAFGDDWIGEGAALATRPPVDLRVNTLKAGRDKVVASLPRLRPEPTRFSPHGLRLAAGPRDWRQPNVQATQGYQRGWFEIQDEGSQIAAGLAEAQPGEQVMDYCAGGGGKTLVFAAAMDNRGQVHAHDTDASRLSAIHGRLRRAGARNVQIHGPDRDLVPLRQKMDCVFVDAPCSGSGTWRRRPDTKWRLNEAGLTRRMEEQYRILKQAAEFVRPGGRLIYATCSVFPCENRQQISRFLDENREFSPASLGGSQEQLTGSAHIPARDRSMLQMSPASTQTDGFFVARLERSQGR